MQNSEKMQLKSAVIYFAADFKFTNYYNMKIINWIIRVLICVAVYTYK